MANARVAERMAAQRKQYEEEEDKLQKQAVKQKAAAASASEKAFAQKEEAKQKAAERKAADLPSAADSKKTSTGYSSKKPGTSYIENSIATQKAAGERYSETKKQQAAQQAAKRKEEDLPGFDGHAAQKAFEQQKAAERIEYLNVKEARDKKSALEQELAELNARAKEETEKAGTVQIVASGRKGANVSFVHPETQKRIDELEKQISDLNKNINLASRTQEKKYLYNSALKAEDFDEYSKEPEKEEKVINPHQQNVKRETETVKAFMTEDEKAVYNYYYNKFGKEKAEEYFDSIREELNQRQAQAIFSGNEGKVLNEYIQGAAAGLENSKEGYQSFLNMIFGIEEPQPTSTMDFVSQMAREDLENSGFKLPEALGGASLGQIGFDAINTTANMLPSLMLGTLGGAGIGAAAIGASAAGNAYNSAITEGYSKEQATNYAALVGASEAALGYVLGGIEATGGKLGKAALAKVLPKIDNALAKAAVNVGGKMLSEFSEEYLQEVLSPVFENIALLEENEIDLLSPEAIYSGILGALSAGGIALLDGSANVPEVLQKAEVPVPFNGNAVTEEQKLVADKIAEIENRPVSEAEKAELMEAVLEVAQEENGSAEVIAEAEKFRDFHRQKELDGATEVANRLGNVVEFDDTIVGNGIHQEDGTIIINPNSKNPVMQVLVHELTHDIETSGLYGDFSQKVLNYAAEVQGIDLAKMEQMVISDYAKAGQKLDKTLADREIVAKFAEEHLFTDEKAIERLCNTEPTLFDRIKYWISDMAAKFRGTPEERFLRDAERLYEKALATRGEVAGAGVEQHHYSSNLSQDIDDVVAGKTFTAPVKIRDFTPQSLVDRGIPQLPMYMNASHIRENVLSEKEALARGFKIKNNTHYHGLGKAKFIEAIDNMDKPVEVYRWKDNSYKNYNSDDYIVITETLDKNNNKIIVPIHINCEDTSSTINILWNEIKSVYGKEDLQNYLIRFGRNNELTKVKIKKAEMPTAGSIPRNQQNSFSSNNVPQKQGGVNDQNSFGRGFDEMAAEAKTPFEEGRAEGISAEETKTPSMERAAPNLNVQDWKNLAEGIAPEFLKIWAMKDFSRFLDSAAGGNKVLRQQLFELYEKPLNEAQGTYAKNYAAKAQSITEKFKELGIKAGSKESAAVQRIGEGVKEIDKNGNTTEYTLDDLKKEFPDSWGNIKAGADYCREIYDEFLHDLNEMYSEIYPATVEEANARVSGYNDRIKNDREYIDRYNEVIGKLEEQKTAKQAELSRKRPNSLIYAELQNQIANIDRRIEIANRRIERIENRKLTKEISRDILQAQIENGEILKNKQIKPRKDYFRHFQELTDEFAEIADIFSNDQRIPPNLAGKSETTKPRTIWTSIAQSRSNNNYYTEDAVGGLLRYTEIAEKLLVFDPLISHFRDVNSAIRAAGSMADNEVKKKGTNAGQFARHMDGVTNQLAGKTNPILDRAIADWGGGLGRATMKAVEALNRRVKSNAILGNVRSALVQIGNLPNAALYIQNPVDWTMGAISLTNSTPEIIEARSKSNFMNRRYMGDTIDALTKEIQQNKLLDKLKEFALWMLGAGDKAAAELIWHTAYSQAVRNPKVLSSGKGLRGYENAVDYADDITRRSIGGRAEGDIPLAEESKIIGLIAPFQIEVTNTFNAFTEQIGKKNAAGIISFEIGVWLINTVLEGIIGDRPLGLDYIDAIWDIVAEAIGDDEEEEKDFWDIVTYAGGRIAGETLSGMPLGAQIGDLITGGDEQKAEKWFGDSDPTRYGTGNIGMGALADAADYFIEGETPEEFYRLATEGGTVGEWTEPVLETVDTFAPLAMPWGGKQLSRSLRGIQQIAEGGAYGTEADGDRYLKFAQEYDPESIIKTVLFGQYASDAGQEYIDSGFSQKLSAEQTEQMEKAEALGMENGEFFDIIMGLKPYDTKEEKQKALLDMDIPVEDKNIIDAILFGGMTYKDIEGGRSVTERDYRGVEEFIVSGLDRKERILWDEDFSERDIERGMKALKDANTKEEKIKGLSDALKVEEDEAFRLIQKMEGNWIENEKDLSEEERVRAEGAAKLYDMSTEDFIAVLNYSKYGAQIVNEKGETEWSTKDEHVIPNVMRATGWDEETAKKNLDIAKKYEFSRADLEEETAAQLDTSAEWYGVEDDKFFVARNVLKTVEGEKDEYGKTVSGTYKKAAINAIKEKLGVDESEATIYYLAAHGDLVLSVDDLSTSHREDLKTAVERGWTERQYLDAVNVIKLSGADSKDEIIKALTDAGASYSMAQGYYNLREDKGYDTKAYFSYGMKTQKQETKGTYFIENYGNGEVTGKEISAWYAAASGCSKKQEYIDAYMSAGATFDQATKFYNLMRGHDRTFNAWYKENGG